MSRYTVRPYKSSSLAVDDNKKASLLKDNSWIRKDSDEDEPVDHDPNFGRTVLSRYRSNETLASSEPAEVKTTKPVSSSSSVQALSKRFSGSQDELRSSTLPSSKTTSSYTKRYSSGKTIEPIKTTTPVKEEPKTSTKTTTVTKNGSTTETTITTTQSLKSPVLKSPTKTETFTERVKSSSKGSQYSTYTPTRTTKVTSTKDAEDKLYDDLIPSSIKDDSSTKNSKTTVTTTETVAVKISPDKNAKDILYNSLIPSSIKDNVPDSKTTVTSTETVTVKSSPNEDGFKTTKTTRTSSTAEDELYGSLLPKSITSDLSSPVRTSITKRESVTVDSSRGGESPTLNSPTSTRTTRYSSYTDDTPSTRSSSYSDSYSSDPKTYSYSKPDSSYEYTSVTGPTAYTKTSYRSSSRSNDSDPIYSKSSTKNVYSSSERPVLEKDLCTICHKSFIGDAKMVLDDMKINCHATCFKCDVCNSNLGNLRAGDSMWIYKRMVHCENCFDITREKWRR
ncbi:sciellin isoform 2-T2 [Odontesthes bonariensis]|uniref:sciellin isoform X2 n=1 Tax=Odontesthes bonariensis TaxID=219752 RepID=UPI003F585005